MNDFFVSVQLRLSSLTRLSSAENERAVFMLVSCRYCSGVHSRAEVCSKRPSRYGKKEDNKISKFRNTNAWKKKRAEIRQRDRLLCQYCLLSNRYSFELLDVHHIIPVSSSWADRLSNDNLITLCRACHSSADKGLITGKELARIAKKNNAVLVQRV